jgi:hypothetical protein
MCHESATSLGGESLATDLTAASGHKGFVLNILMGHRQITLKNNDDNRRHNAYQTVDVSKPPLLCGFPIQSETEVPNGRVITQANQKAVLRA